MHWDIFCRVIDNHGDIGMCWRLARQLARAGDAVRLWVDDGRALGWMAPQGEPGVVVIDWRDPAAVRRAVADAPPDVLVEAFGCEPEPALVARFRASAPLPEGEGAKQGEVAPHAWINLEYLSAEPYVERLHRLPSPVFRGPGEGLTKWFFYPGFTPATGGLLREPELAQAQAAFDRAGWLAAHGIPWLGERLVSLFCYEPPALAEVLRQWMAAPEPTRLLVTPGRAAASVRQALDGMPAGARGTLSITWLPHLTQPDFDALLRACDLNLVRGEDSFVRAHWAGAPFVWQIYPQDDDAHHVKLNAWLDWLDAPASLRAFHHAWNGFSAAPPVRPDAAALADWRRAAQAGRARLLAQDDLATQLRRFVTQKS